MNVCSKILKVVLAILLIVSVSGTYSSLNSAADDILLNTMDKYNSEGKGGKIPSFTITKKYTVTYIGAYFGAIYTKSNPTVRSWLLDENGKKVGGGELTPETGMGVADAVFSNIGTFSLEPGTYEFYTDERSTWKINKNGYYQVLIKGIPE